MSGESPRQIGRYEVITLLGEGGMARAYLAVSRGPGGFNKLAVIKEILPQYASDSEFVNMFLDEARLAARLHHPNIVQTFDVAEHDGSYVLAMEYLEGLSLASIYRRIHPRVLPIETHLWVLTQVLTGLHYAHTLCDYDGTPLGVVHRDVNPANVLVTYAGDVKLLDFGVAKARGALAAPSEKNIKGKPAYCAPEQLWGGEPDARADVFAAGVMLWEVMAGRRFNRSKSLIEAAKTRLSGKEPMIREVYPDADPGLAEICDRAMAWDPGQRFANAAEFRIELQAQLDKRTVPGRRILVERMEEVFAADRRELAKLIERRLAEKSSRLTSSAQLSVARPLPSPAPENPPAMAASEQVTPAKPISVPVKTSNEARPKLKMTTGLVIGTAIMASVAGGMLIWTLRGPARQPEHVEKVATPTPAPQPSLPALPAAPAPIPAAGPPAAPAEMVNVAAAPANPRSASPGPKPRAQALKVRPVKSQSKPAQPGPLPNAVTRAAATSRIAGPAPGEAPLAPAEAPPPPSPAPRRRPQSSEQSGSSVQPGAHLQRSAPLHTNVDEKDPYSP